jgi:choline dehydrogenase-like flavoprotein
MRADDYDVIIIGAGACGGMLARQLAPTGKRILLLERGSWLPREKRNWDPVAVAVQQCYHNAPDYLDAAGRPFKSNNLHYVGGKSKIWGATFYRMREADFGRVEHQDGISPAWPLSYRDFAPYYAEAERLFDARGQRGEEPTEPPADQPYPHPAMPHEPRLEEIAHVLRQRGLHPAHQPLAIRRHVERPHLSQCIRCNTCDGFPCLVSAKADGEFNGVRPALEHPNVTLLTEAKAERLLVSPSGREVIGVQATVQGERQTVRGDMVVLACGAIHSALLLLRSANDKHPDGLANGSGLVGRRYMHHVFSLIAAVTGRRDDTVFQKTLALNDFYWGTEDFRHPMGNIQTVGKALPPMFATFVDPPPKGLTHQQLAERSTEWWLTTEDLPLPENRVTWDGDTVRLRYRPTNTGAHKRLVKRWLDILKTMEMQDDAIRESLYFVRPIGIGHVAHQCGTCSFGTDPETSVLNLSCRAHEVENLYVADGSFFPSSSAINPTATVLANVLRIAEHLHQRLG